MSKIKKRTIRTIISLSMLIIMIIIQATTNIQPIVNISIHIVIYLLVGYEILIKALRNIIYGKMLDENFLMTIATIGAFIIGEYSEAVAVMIFYQVGEIFQTIAVRKSRKSVARLMDIRPDIANVVEEEKIVQKFPEEVEVGDIIEIKPGEKIPLDCVVVSGQSDINLSMLTGESIPHCVRTGDKLISGSVNIDGVLRAEVTSLYQDSTVSKILDLVQNASEKKSKSEKFITKFARIYTPVVVGLAALIGLIPPIFLGHWADWIYRALSFLVVSCPCALVISIPLSFFAGIGCASKYGILIKGTNYLELLPKIDTFIFDKTGTITKGDLKVKQIVGNKNDVLKYASHAEYKSTHPLATAILDYSKINVTEKYNYTNIFGKGVIAKNNTHKIICGNTTLLKENNIQFDEIITPDSVVYVALDNKYIGAIIIGDEIKDNAKAIIIELKSIKAKTILLSGDGDASVEMVAKNIGIDEYHSHMLPDEKLKHIEKLIENGKKVAFVGDGINDSPSLVRADIGISMGAIGSDSSIEASDIVIMNDNLSKISLARKIAKKTIGIVKQNIYFAIGVKVLILLLTAFGLSNMWWAIFGDVGVSVIAILNAIRALKIKQ